MTGCNPDQTAIDPFWFNECFLIPMPVGRSAVNLRELMHAIRELGNGVLFYHFFQSRLITNVPKIEYPNEFSSWAATALQDVKLSEKLSSFDPFAYNDLAQVRQAVCDLLEEYLWDLPTVPWARPGLEFHFCEASTVVMTSEIAAVTLREFCSGLRQVGLDSVYYHFFESRWRLTSRQGDDFSFWIETNFDFPELVEAIRSIDIYFYSLKEIREKLLELIETTGGAVCG